MGRIERNLGEVLSIEVHVVPLGRVFPAYESIFLPTACIEVPVLRTTEHVIPAGPFESSELAKHLIASGEFPFERVDSPSIGKFVSESFDDVYSDTHYFVMDDATILMFIYATGVEEVLFPPGFAVDYVVPGDINYNSLSIGIQNIKNMHARLSPSES